MKFLILAVCVACAAAVSDEKTAQIVSSNSDSSPDGSFQYGYETDNGISSNAAGVVKQLEKDVVALEITGNTQYISPEGVPVQLTYTANENGFQPAGDHLPTPPAPEPIPAYIQRALEYIAAHPYDEEKQLKKGSSN